MAHWQRHNTLLFALLAYGILWYSLHPFLGYLLDSDAVAYLTIARRVAEGDWLKSVNGLWSPLNAWLLVPFIKSGIDAWWAAKVLNAVFGAMVLGLTYGLFYRLGFEKWIRNLLIGVSVVVVVFFSYFQIFGDVLQLIFALLYVHLFITKGFYQRKGYILLSAVCMGIGFYAKSYSLIFYLLHFTSMGIMSCLHKELQWKQFFINWTVGLFTIFMIALPWSFQMKEKYGFHAITGLAGKLNMSWYINSGKTFNDSIVLLIPPAHDDSPSFWEDPYLSQGELSTPLSSTHHFFRWILRVGHTCLVALACSVEISACYLLIILLLLYDIYKKRKIPEKPFDSILLAVLLLPLGYLAMHIETRYIWLNTFLIMALGVYLFRETRWSMNARTLIIILSISFLPYVVFKMIRLQNKNKDLFITAAHLKQAGIEGAIVSNINEEGNLWVIAYLAGINNYTIEKENYSLETLMAEMKRYKVTYYFHYPNEGGRYNANDKKFQQFFKPILSDTASGAMLYRLN